MPHRAVGEQIEKSPPGGVLEVALPMEDLLGVVGGQGAVNAEHAHESRGDLDPLGPGFILPGSARPADDVDALNLAGRKAEAQGVAEADALGHRVARLAPKGKLMEAHELEELVALGGLLAVGDQASIESPLRGAHRISSSPVCPETSTNCVKLLRPA